MSYEQPSPLKIVPDITAGNVSGVEQDYLLGDFTMIDKLVLSDGEIVEVRKSAGCGGNEGVFISLATVKKVVGWLRKHNNFNECGAERGAGLLLTIKDWQALKATVEKEG